MVCVAPESHRQLANLLDQGEGGLALLLADHVTQNAPEQADVLDQGIVFVGFFGAQGLSPGCGAGMLQRGMLASRAEPYPAKT
jgi:hypothetical protein